MVYLMCWFNTKNTKNRFLGNKKGNKFIGNYRKYYNFKVLSNNRLLLV